MTEESLPLLELKEKLDSRKARAALYAALAKAQAGFKPVAKNRAVEIRKKEGGSFRFEYADLEQLISCTREALSANGLAVVQTIFKDELSTELLHADGGSIRSAVELPRMGADPKAYGAAITYLRRYAYAALLCLAADDDLDEDGDQTDQSAPAPRTRQEPKPKPKAETSGEKLANAAQLKWAKDRLATLEQEAGIALLKKHGIEALDTQLTATAFEALKKELLA